jgi:hypothetical protein
MAARALLLSILVLPLAAPSAAASAREEGFAIDDLTPIGKKAAAALGPGYIFRAEPERVTLYCLECPGSPMIDILLGTQTDGTEARVRSGVTTIADLEQICRSRNDDCRVTALNVAPAVGWVSRYPRASGEGSTAAIILGGQMLTVRIIVSGSGTSSDLMGRVLPVLRVTVIAQ